MVFYEEVQVLAGFCMKFILLTLIHFFEPLTGEVTQLIAHLLAHQQLLLNLILRHQVFRIETLPKLLHQQGSLLLLECFLSLGQPLGFIQLVALFHAVYKIALKC